MMMMMSRIETLRQRWIATAASWRVRQVSSLTSLFLFYRMILFFVTMMVRTTTSYGGGYVQKKYTIYSMYLGVYGIQ